MAIKLLLCDSPDGLAQLQYALLKSGDDLETEVADDAIRAVELAARYQPDVVVVEPSMPEVNGAELIRRLTATAPSAKILCWSAGSSPRLVAETLAAGADGYLLKDAGTDAVGSAIRAVLTGAVALDPSVALAVAERLAHGMAREEELETAVDDMNRRLEQMNEAKAEFLANISHELRTPVTVAKGIAYVLRNRGVPEDEKGEFLEKLESALERLMALIEEILTIAELDRGSLNLSFAEVDLAPILRNVADEIVRRYRGITLERALPEALIGWADPARISEVVRQLLENACIYSEGLPISITGRSLDEGVVVSVTDRGVGMPREVATAAFNEPFSAGEGILRKEKAGAGVGLHLARKLILEHGGIIWADPLPGGGTRVSFCLPSDAKHRVLEKPVVGDDALPLQAERAVP
jgi:signal transduction histidine kinase